MPRDYRVYLEDIRGAIEKIARYTARMSRTTDESVSPGLKA
jgi:uncharacterized protein with HEPN domain